MYDIYSYDKTRHDGGKEFDFDGLKFEHAVMTQEILFELIKALLDYRSARLTISYDGGYLEVTQR